MSTKPSLSLLVQTSALAAIVFGSLALAPKTAHAQAPSFEGGETHTPSSSASARGAGTNGHSRVRDGRFNSRAAALDGAVGAHAGERQSDNGTAVESAAGGHIATASASTTHDAPPGRGEDGTRARDTATAAFAGYGDARAIGLLHRAAAVGDGYGRASARNGGRGGSSASAAITRSGRVEAISSEASARGTTNGGDVRAGVNETSASARLHGAGNITAGAPVVQPGDVLVPLGGRGLDEYASRRGGPVTFVGATVSSDGDGHGAVRASRGSQSGASARFRMGPRVPSMGSYRAGRGL
jgi:hypothetical protein